MCTFEKFTRTLCINLETFSLDTLRAEKFEFISRRPKAGHAKVLDSIERSLDAGVKPLKVNCVVMRGLNDDEILDFVELTRDKCIDVRFIEYMPFDGNKWNTGKMVSYQEMVDIITSRYPEFQRIKDAPNDTSKGFKVPGQVIKSKQKFQIHNLYIQKIMCFLN